MFLPGFSFSKFFVAVIYVIRYRGCQEWFGPHPGALCRMSEERCVCVALNSLGRRRCKCPRKSAALLHPYTLSHHSFTLPHICSCFLCEFISFAVVLVEC